MFRRNLPQKSSSHATPSPACGCEAVVGERDGTVGAGVPGVRGADAAVHRREFLRPGDRDLALRLQNARHGDAEIVVLRQGRPDQLLEVRIRERCSTRRDRRTSAAPADRRTRVGAAIDRRHRDLRSFVVRTDGAAGGSEADDAEQENPSKRHLSRLLPATARPAPPSAALPRRPSPSTNV